MKRSTISILITAGLLAVLLSGCRLGGGTEGEAAGSGTKENVSKPAAGTAQEPVPESKVNQETEVSVCLKIWNHSIGISGIRIGCCS